MKRTFALLLCVLMLLLLLASCSKKDEGVADTTAANGAVSTVSTDTEAETIPPEYLDELPDNLNYNGASIRILSRDVTGATDEITVKRTNGNAINDAVYNRQKAVEERLNVKISNNIIPTESTWGIMKEYIACQKAGEDIYELIAGVTYQSCVGLLTDNVFYNLYNEDISTYLNLDKKYWSPLANEALNYNGAQYICTGHIAMTMYRYMFATYFNTDILNNAHVDLYGIVEKGEWTLEKQKNLAAELSEEGGGNGAEIEVGTGDTIGFLTTHSLSIDPYWSSCELKVLQKNTNDTYDLMLYESSNYERISNTLQKLVEMKNTNGIVMLDYITGDLEQEDIAKEFGNGKVAMATLRLVASENASLTNVDYGLVPIARLDTEQDEYYSYVHDQVTGFGVPSIISPDAHDRLQMIGAFLEAMASESYLSLRPTYYDKVLKGRYMTDPKAAEMLDYMVDHIKIDAGIFYTKRLESIHQDLRYSVRDGDNSMATRFGAKQTSVITAFNNLKTELAKLPK